MLILKEQDIFEPSVLLKIQDAVTVSPEDVLDGPHGHGRNRHLVVRRLDDNLVGADAIHLVVESFTLAVQCALNPQRGKLVGDNPQRPARGIPAAAIRPVGEDFRRCLGFVSETKGAESTAVNLHFLAHEVGWPFGAIRSDDDPATRDRVLT